MIEDSEESRKAEAELLRGIEWDKVFRYCPNCDKEYELPENMLTCVICAKPLSHEE